MIVQIMKKLQLLIQQELIIYKIKLETVLGGINLVGQNTSILLKQNGDIINQYQDNKSYTIKNTNNNVKYGIR